jgi:hypothetical protein
MVSPHDGQVIVSVSWRDGTIAMPHLPCYNAH